MRLSLILLSVFLLFSQKIVLGQEANGSNSTIKKLHKVEPRQLLETKWKYTYAIHLESNTTIHKAENFYEYFLYFRYDYTYQQYLNGRLTKGEFALDENNLLYSFKHIKSFKVSELSHHHLILEFTQENSKGTYQYHFIKVDSKDAPFVKPANELPDILVEIENKKSESRFLAFLKKKKKKKSKKKKKKKSYRDTRTYINIELIGGGYYGGIDPVLKDYIHIKTDGRLIQEFKSQKQGLRVTRKNIPREELEEFAKFIDSKGFFELERLYDCTTALCQKRKKLKPKPIPLRLAIAYGKKKKVITINIWGKDEYNMRYIEYPDVLENIILSIQKMASRIEED